MNISKEKLISAVKYVRSYARRIDRLDLACYCGRGERSELIEALSAYQNDDGGFGQAIEPDFRVPDSSVTATTIAFNYLIEHNASSESGIVRKGIEYLIPTYHLETNSWPPVCKEITKYPRANWWEYYPPIIYRPDEPDWGNPNMQVVGIFNHYSDLVDSVFLSSLNEKAVAWLDSNETAEAFALLCALRYCESLAGDDREHGRKRLSDMVKEVVEKEPAEWGKNKPQPVWYVRKPDALLANTFTEEIQHNIDFLTSQQSHDGSWQPSWDWGRYKGDWPQAKVEWAGHMTVANIKLLIDFRRLDAPDLENMF